MSFYPTPTRMSRCRAAFQCQPARPRPPSRSRPIIPGNQIRITITATYGGSTVSTQLTIDASGGNTDVANLTISPSTFVPGQVLTGTVTLNLSAPCGGVGVILSSSNSGVGVPSPISVPGGTSDTAAHLHLESRHSTRRNNSFERRCRGGLTSSGAGNRCSGILFGSRTHDSTGRRRRAGSGHRSRQPVSSSQCTPDDYDRRSSSACFFRWTYTRVGGPIPGKC